jgi:hypothetical protein
MSWTANIELANDIRKVSISREGRLLSYKDVIHAWVNDASFVNYFSSVLSASPFEAFFWETPPVTTGTVNRVFEHVEIDSPLLSRMPVNPQPFGEYFNSASAEQQVVAFSNLGGDAKLVAPCPVGDAHDYPHLAAFMRKAPGEQVEVLWKRVGEQAWKILSDKRTWISTAGTGVAWLHVRLDSFPKYYSYTAYRDSE